MKRMIYLDHAATTAVRPEVLKAMIPYFGEKYGNPSSIYDFASISKTAIRSARSAVASLIGADERDIYFTGGGSEADNWAIKCAAEAYSHRGHHIITSKIEHHAVLHTCQYLERCGYSVTYLTPDESGIISPRALRTAIRPDTILVSIMTANNEIGTIQPIREIAEAAHARGVLLHTDAVQAVGHIPVDMKALQTDMLSMSAHKFGGPKGIGALAVRSGVRLSPLLFGGEQERGLRPGTENTPAIVCMGHALERVVSELPQSMAYVARLRDALMDGILQRIPGARVIGSISRRLPGNRHVSFPGADTRLLLMRLDMEGIAASAGSACASGAVERSHVLRALGRPMEGWADLRLTLGMDNSPQEITRTVDALVRILNP